MLPSFLAMLQVPVGWTSRRPSGFDAAGEKDFKSNEIIKYFNDISEQMQRQKDSVCVFAYPISVSLIVAGGGGAGGGTAATHSLVSIASPADSPLKQVS